MEKTFKELFQSLVKGPEPQLNEVLHYMSMGKDRRALIQEWFKRNPNSKILVNARWTRQVKLDSDLKSLIKRGFLKQIKEYYPSFRGGHHKTYLIKA